MITCTHIQRIENLDFGKYLQLPQYSHSYLKAEKHGFISQREFTAKMQLGSLVDAIRTRGEVDMLHTLYPAAKKIAAQLHAEFGWALDKLQKQISYTGTMCYHAGKIIFELPVKGRPDFELPGQLIIDLKVTSEPKEKIDRLSHFFGYPNQQFCYGKLSACTDAFLLFYTTKTNEVLTPRHIRIGDSNAFWQEKILKFGKVCN